ncbi:Glycosyl transferase family 2 [Nocardioides lianchengensis]|uniref:Glycosyl transferase family 2 n=1 Tax=Nocardioides lianchengensis TaxID=1045774 RepID=A0A1G6SJE8_9ACTN|nr:Glycosyl transferase family 2 [Nocardioides lianchengensis]
MTGTTRRPDVTAVVCAYTAARWTDLVAALDGLATQTVAPSQVLVVVDHEDDLLARVREAFPDVEAVPSTRLRGLSGARNTAVGLARGEVVAFLDDDAVPRPDWLERMLEPYDDPDVLAVGGAARPVWPDGARPGQLATELDWVVGCTYRGLPEERADVRNLMGCSMSFRRTALEELGGFAEGAGRIGALPLGCEETELCIRLRQRHPHARVVLEPASVVDHRVTADRTTWRYLRTRSYAEGLSKAAMAAVVGSTDATAVERGYVTRVLPGGVRRELARAARGDRDGWQGAAGIVTALAATTAGYARGRLGPRARLVRRAEEARTA